MRKTASLSKTPNKNGCLKIKKKKRGTTKKVEAKEIGANVQKDGTVTVKGTDGKMKVLPKTGEAENIALSVLGGLFVLGSGVILKKKGLID